MAKPNMAQHYISHLSETFPFKSTNLKEHLSQNRPFPWTAKPNMAEHHFYLSIRGKRPLDSYRHYAAATRVSSTAPLSWGILFADASAHTVCSVIPHPPEISSVCSSPQRHVVVALRARQQNTWLWRTRPAIHSSRPSFPKWKAIERWQMFDHGQSGFSHWWNCPMLNTCSEHVQVQRL